MLTFSEIIALIFCGTAAGILLNSEEWDSLTPSLKPGLSFILSWIFTLLAALITFGS